MEVNLERLEHLVKLMEDRELVELEIEENGEFFGLERAPRRRAAASAVPVDLVEPACTVTSGRVGVYAGRTAVGERVKNGQLLGEIRVMDVKYEVHSPADGVIEEIFVENGVGVEYGQPILRIGTR